MKYIVKISKGFKKSFKKLSIGDKELTLQIIETLAQNKKLDACHKDHKLKGEYEGLRECHIKPDLLLIYKIMDEKLILVCVSVGSHSELF